MKIPTKCPCCRDPLMSSYQESRSGPGSWKKTCANKLSHKFTCMHFESSEDLSLISVELTNNLSATWWPKSNKLVVTSTVVNDHRIAGRDGYMWLPYFEPDFSDYKKLIEKLRTYVMFS